MFDTLGVTRLSDRAELTALFRRVRHATEVLTAGLSPEVQTIQSMPDVSPTKWHLAHTSWFFETFVLMPYLSGYRVFHPDYSYLFNSYYESVGRRHPRAERGLIARPDVKEAGAYREHVTAAVLDLVNRAGQSEWPEILRLLELGINHEEQHQELILMDIKHVLSLNPSKPFYRQSRKIAGLSRGNSAADWLEFSCGLIEIGHRGPWFAFDNEMPRHNVWLEPFRLATRLVTCGEYLEFMDDGGYLRPELWLSDGWATVNAQGWEAPLYWERGNGGDWAVFQLSGLEPLNPEQPVCHVSHYEADAFARWAGRRLPSEAEWEVAAANVPEEGNFAELEIFAPMPATFQAGALAQMFGDVWEWASSPYIGYPGFRIAPGAVGEYNGKFMSSQMVLRGGSAITPSRHMRRTYRNFFPPSARWAFSGIRLAE